MSLLALLTELGSGATGGSEGDPKAATLEGLHPVLKMASLWLHRWNSLSLFLLSLYTLPHPRSQGQSNQGRIALNWLRNGSSAASKPTMMVFCKQTQLVLWR